MTAICFVAHPNQNDWIFKLILSLVKQKQVVGLQFWIVIWQQNQLKPFRQRL